MGRVVGRAGVQRRGGRPERGAQLVAGVGGGHGDLHRVGAEHAHGRELHGVGLGGLVGKRVAVGRDQRGQRRVEAEGVEPGHLAGLLAGGHRQLRELAAGKPEVARRHAEVHEPGHRHAGVRGQAHEGQLDLGAGGQLDLLAAAHDLQGVGLERADPVEFGLERGLGGRVGRVVGRAGVQRRGGRPERGAQLVAGVGGGHGDLHRVGAEHAHGRELHGVGLGA